MPELSDIDRHLEELEAQLDASARLDPRELAAIVAAVPDIIYRVDGRGDIVFISDAIRKYGYDPVALVGSSLFDLIHPEDRDRARHRVNDRRTGERSTRSLELRLVTRDRQSVPFELKESDTATTLVVDAEGVYASAAPRSEHFLYTQGVARDTSERRRLEESLEAARREVARRMGQHAVQIRAAYAELQRQVRRRERQEAESAVLQRVRDEIWRMAAPSQVDRVLHAVHTGLTELGIRYNGLAINVIDALHGAQHTGYRRPGNGEGSWHRSSDAGHDERILQFVRGAQVVYRPDLHAEDRFGERHRIEEVWGSPVHSVVDAPFAGGTLAINSREPEAFCAQDLDLLGRMAAVLQEGFARVRDLAALQARTDEAEALAAQRQAALDREVGLGRIRDRILAMRQMRDLPDADYWIRELRNLGVPIGGISLQFPGSSASAFVSFFFEGKNYSADQPLADFPWIEEVWRTQAPVLVDRERLVAEGYGSWDITCILEVPLQGGGSLAVNRRDGGLFDADMVRATLAFTGVVAEGVQRMRDFERLTESEERYRSLVERLPVGVAHTTTSGRFLYLNPYARALLGYDADELTRLPAEEIYVNPADREELARSLRERGVHSFEYPLRRKGGRRIWVRGTSRVVQNPATGRNEYHGFLEDVTDRKMMEKEYSRLEEQLRQSQKMEAVGQLTAGIAHNFNNMLQGISGNLQLALLDAQGDICQLLADADRVTHRAAEMIRQLMVFARQGIQPVIRPVRLGPIIANTIEICRRTFDRKIEIECSAIDDESVLADPGLLQQVFLNLLINARDALDDADKERALIHISASRADAKGGDAAPPLGIGPGPFVQVSVSDNGTGMEDAVRSRIFDPFFTTKPVDKGTGLGLATVYGIVTQHRGWITCESQFGEGTTFRLFIPAAPDEGRPDSPSPAPRPATGAAKTLLVIDDEEVVRDSTSRLLERRGYRVLVAADGPQGLRLFEQEGDGVDLVLLDLSMPAMSGKDVLIRLRRLRPQVKILIFTGYSTGEEEVDGADGIVQKPFTVDELFGRIHQLLGG